MKHRLVNTCGYLLLIVSVFLAAGLLAERCGVLQ